MTQADLRTKEAATWLRRRQTALAEEVVARIYVAHPALWQPFGEAGRAKSVRDVGYHLSYLAEALEVADPMLFAEYVVWAQTLFANLPFPEGTLEVTLTSLQEALQAALPPALWEVVMPYLEAGWAQLSETPLTPPSFLPPDAPLNDLAQAYLDALLAGERHAAARLVLDAVDAGTTIKEIYLHVFQPVQREIGRLWQLNQVTVAQEHYCTAATQLVMSQLYPRLFDIPKKGRRLVATCVGGELHEIGVRMVADFFEMEGWDTYYLGASTPTESVLQALEAREADILAVSATLVFHVSEVAALIKRVREAWPEDRRPSILVGGLPFNTSPDLWRKVGADGYAPDAQAAIALAEQWTQA
ncbi:MAG: cobalamin B12-binding domain-containing protein [Anaerolineae bacterium]